MLAVILFVWLIGFLQILSWKHEKYLVLSALKNPITTFILLSRQSNLSFKTICHKHLLNLFMSDVQANKRNEAEKKEKQSIFRPVSSRAHIIMYALLLYR